MQYWRFIRPGTIRVGTSGVDAQLGTAAFADPASDRVVVVFLNSTNQPRSVAARLQDGTALKPHQFFVTDATRDCTEISASHDGHEFVVPAESVATVLLSKASTQNN